MSTLTMDFQAIRKIVLEQSGIVLDERKDYLIESRMLQLAREEGHKNLESLLDALRNDTSRRLQWKVVEAMTTNETSFFRDLHPFETLATHILPELAEVRKNSRRLRIWCAACSSGQEPYSIAMTIKEKVPVLNGWKISILASDISTEMIEKSRAGRYSQLEVNRGLPAAMLVKYFKKEGSTWQVCDELKSMISYRQVNLNGAWPVLDQFDLIFLRNVLIYFSVDDKKKILEKMRRVMRPDAFIFLGGTETAFSVDDNLELCQYGRTVCYKRK